MKFCRFLTRANVKTRKAGLLPIRDLPQFGLGGSLGFPNDGPETALFMKRMQVSHSRDVEMDSLAIRVCIALQTLSGALLMPPAIPLVADCRVMESTTI